MPGHIIVAQSNRIKTLFKAHRMGNGSEEVEKGKTKIMKVFSTPFPLPRHFKRERKYLWRGHQKPERNRYLIMRLIIYLLRGVKCSRPQPNRAYFKFLFKKNNTNVACTIFKLFSSETPEIY